MMRRWLVAVITVVLFLLGGVGGWFGHVMLTGKNYDKAWAAYEEEVKAWKDVDGRRSVLAPECEVLLGEDECADLIKASEEAEKASKDLPLELKKAGMASAADVKNVKAATEEIKAEREKIEQALTEVEKSAEKVVSKKFDSVKEEAEAKVEDASKLAGEWDGKVKDDSALTDLEESANALSDEIEKWEDVPSGQEGVKAYLELRRLMGVLDEAKAKADKSHKQWLEENGASKEEVAAGMAKAVQSELEGRGITGIDANLYNDFGVCFADKTYDSISINMRNVIASGDPDAIDSSSPETPEEEAVLSSAMDECGAVLVNAIG